VSDVLSFIGVFFSNTWSMFTQTVYPGTGMTIAVILVGMFLVGFGFRILGYVFGFSLGDFERFNARNARITKAKISKERQNDER